MLVVAYWEMDAKDIDKVLSLYRKALKMREEGKINHPKMVSDNYIFSSTGKGFRIFDVTDPVQLENLKYHYDPYMKWTIKPIIKAEDSIKAYENLKK
jgi:hypothetical protein